MSAGGTFQFTLPRGERLTTPKGGNEMLKVSIHAPAGGATLVPRLRKLGVDVSIHAPAGGATCLPRASRITATGFNSRSRGGSDSRRASARHARSCSFNSRSRGGSDDGRGTAVTDTLRFQFTLPRGERPGARSTGSGRQGFNSRSRGGSDNNFCTTTTEALKFQFTLPRGERLPSAGRSCVV